MKPSFYVQSNLKFPLRDVVNSRQKVTWRLRISYHLWTIFTNSTALKFILYRKSAVSRLITSNPMYQEITFLLILPFSNTNWLHYHYQMEVTFEWPNLVKYGYLTTIPFACKRIFMMRSLDYFCSIVYLRPSTNGFVLSEKVCYSTILN